MGRSTCFRMHARPQRIFRPIHASDAKDNVLGELVDVNARCGLVRNARLVTISSILHAIARSLTTHALTLAQQ